jgi:alanyl-tRNA synthetase
VLDFDGEQINVTDTKKENNLIIHFTETLPANIQTQVMAKVDQHKRRSTTVHHSATHLLHAALRKY